MHHEGGALLHTWPGVYFESAFRGTGVGIALSDADGYYNVEIDGRYHSTIETPGTKTTWISALPDGRHTIRLTKRAESTTEVPRFFGFVPQPGGAILEAPKARSRQIEFIGDSGTAGYGILSETRECTPAEVRQRSDVDRTFAVLTARHYDADYHVDAFSGMGVVRNWNGGMRALDFRTVYDRVLREQPGSTWVVPPEWRPRLVVIALGQNDFSTPIQPGEPWTDVSLRSAFKAAYRELIETVRSRYGADTTVVLGSMSLPHLAALRPAVQEIVAEENAAGHARVHHWGFDGLELGGCQWHPSVRDHERLSRELVAWIDSRPDVW